MKVALHAARGRAGARCARNGSPVDREQLLCGILAASPHPVASANAQGATELCVCM